MRRYAELRIVATVTIVVVAHTFSTLFAAEPAGAPIPATPAFTTPDIKPTFGDWLTGRPMALAKKVALTDPLQKPPFAGQSPDSLKGMAAGIRAVQLDAPNRVKAAAYLGTVDCVTYPQAQAMLIATMQEDPAEEVRYEAVMALRKMMLRGCCNMETLCECESCRARKQAAYETERHSKKTQQALIHEAKGPAKKEARKASRTTPETRYDCCKGCCNVKVLKALFKVAYDKDEECCWVEPSERVRNAAAEGLCLCTVYKGTATELAPVPPMTDENKGEEKEVKPKEDIEVRPNESNEKAPELKSTTLPPSPISLLRGTDTYPSIAALNGYCIVGLKARLFHGAKPSFSSVFEDRTYYFASQAAKDEFDVNPANFAPAYGGVDPVAWLENREAVEGRFLREYEGRFYLFAEKENWQTFKAAPRRFVLKSVESSRNLVNR